MKKLIFLFAFMITAFAAMAQTQNPVIVSPPYKFQKYVHVQGSLFADSILLSTDSSHRTATTLWVLQQAASGKLSGSVHTNNGLQGNGTAGSPVGLGGSLSQTNTNIFLSGSQVFTVGNTGASPNYSALTIRSGAMEMTTGALPFTGKLTDISMGAGGFQLLSYDPSAGATALQINYAGFNGMWIRDDQYSLGAQFLNDYSANQRLNDNAVASIGAVKQIADSVKGTFGVYTGGNGITLSGSQFRLGGALSGATTVQAGASNNMVFNSISGSSTASWQLFNGILTNTIAVTSHGSAFSQYAISGSDPQLKVAYQNSAGTAFKQLIYGIANKGIQVTESVDNTGFIYAADYGTAQRLQRLAVPSVGTSIALMDSVKATLSGTYAPINSPSFTGTVTIPVASNAFKIGTTSVGALVTTDGAGSVHVNSFSGSGNSVLDTSPSISTPTLIIPNITGGYWTMTGTTSGTVSFKTQPTAGTYNWNYPITAGSSGQLLTSAGGGSSAMTWTDITNYAFGAPTATTPTTSDNSTLIATTAYVQANFAATTIYFASGLFTGAGTSGSPYDIGSGHITVAMLSATGTPSSSTYLRGDGTWSTPASGFTNPMTTLGDMMYENSTPAAARLAGNTTTTQKFLTQTGTGSVSAAPVWVDLFGGNNTFSGTNTYNGVTTVATTNTASSGASNVNYGLFVNNTVNQTGTAGFSDIYVNRINTAPGSGGQNLLRLDVGGSSVLTVNTTGGITGSSSVTMNGAFTTNQFSTSSTFSADGLYMFNNATATSGNPSLNSLRVRWMSPVWNTTPTAAQNFAFILNEMRTVSGTTPTYALYWASNLSTTSTMGTATDVAKLDNGGTFSANHLAGFSSTPTIAAGTGAGTSPTVSVSGNDVAGILNITTGTTPSGSNAIVATITFNKTFVSAPKGVVISPANTNAIALAGSAQVFVPANGQTNGTTTTTFVLESGSTSLGASTAYIWTYHVIQ